MQKLTTCLCYKNQAEEAVNFYLSVFKNGKISGITRCGEGEYGGPPGSVRTVSFELFGQKFLAINGGPDFKFTDGISIMVNCDTQDELDEIWEKLSAGGEQVVCGWVRDKFGVSWQVVPREVEKWINDPDPAKSQRVMNAIFASVKFDIETLRKAYEGS